MHRDFREGGVSRLRRGRSGGERDGGELQRGGDARPEVPSAGDVGPTHLHLQDTRVR